MGQAKIRRAALENAVPAKDVQCRVFDTVRRTVAALGPPGVAADCMYHAAATVGALKAAGIDAEMQAGAAWWAVGPAPGDVVVHGLDEDGRRIAHHVVWEAPSQAFHAWATYRVFGTPFVVDMTFYQIPEKARLIAEADGKPLNVTIPVPPFYWGRMPADVSFHKSKLGDWNVVPVPGLLTDALPRTPCGEVMMAAAQMYRCPALEVFGIGLAAD